MTTFPAYASQFEIYPKTGPAFKHLSPLLSRLKRVDFALRVDNPSVNQGQMASDFDGRLEKSLHAIGASSHELQLRAGVPQKLDFSFKFRSRVVAVEIEKSNREKILRDFLKCHMYLHAGADFTLVGLPRNYPHKHGIWDLYDFGVQRFDECREYGFGTAALFGRILLIGFQQFDAVTGEPLSQTTRKQMRQRAAGAIPS